MKGTISWISLSDNSLKLPPKKEGDGNYYQDSVNVLMYRAGFAITEGSYCYLTQIWMPFPPTHYAYINEPIQ